MSVFTGYWWKFWYFFMWMIVLLIRRVFCHLNRNGKQQVQWNLRNIMASYSRKKNSQLFVLILSMNENIYHISVKNFVQDFNWLVGDLEDKSRVGFVLVFLPFNITTRHIWCVYFRLQSLMVVHLHRFLNCWFFSIFFPNCYVLKLLVTYSLHYSFMVHIVHNGRFEWKDQCTCSCL